MQMVAKKLCRPGGSGTRQIQPGETFEATPQMVKIAQAFGWADLAPDLAPEPVQEEAEVEEVQTNEEQTQEQPETMNAAPRKTAKKAAKKTKPVVEKPAKRTYNTRRMTAKR